VRVSVATSVAVLPIAALTSGTVSVVSALVTVKVPVPLLAV